MKRKFRNLKIHQKILFSNTILFILPCLILSICLFYFMQRKGNIQLNESRLVILRQIDENLEGIFEGIVLLSNYFACNTDINKIISRDSFSSDYKEMSALKEIKESFNNSRIVYSNLNYNLQILGFNGKNYSPKDTADTNVIYPDIEKMKTEDWYPSLQQHSNAIHYIPAYRSNELQKTAQEGIIYAVKLIKNLNSGREVALLSIEIDNKIIQQLFVQGMNGHNPQFFLMDETGKIFSSTKEELVGKNISLDTYIHKLTENSYGYFPAKINGTLSQVCFVTNRTTGWKLVMFDDQKGLGWANNQLIILILSISVLYLLLTVLMSFYNSKYISMPVQKLKSDMDMAEKGNLSVRATIESEDEFGELGKQFNSMLNRIERLISELAEKEEEQRALELNALQAQINPHFLYNTLASIRFLIEMDMPEKADESLVALVKLLRKTFSESRKLITVKEELLAVENYLILMCNRYRGTFEWDINVEKEAEECLIPRISIQPLVENSISHGFCGKTETGHIQINGNVCGEDVIIQVIDDGIGGDSAKIQRMIDQDLGIRKMEQFNGVGLRNVHERLKLFFGEHYGLSIFDVQPEGICIDIRIPLHYIPEHEPYKESRKERL